MQKTQIYFPRSRSAINAHRPNILNTQFMFCKEVFHKLKHIFYFGGCFQFFAQKEVLYDTIISAQISNSALKRLFDSGTNLSFFLASFPRIVVAISNTHGLRSSSAIV